jgi:hypothetical protein
MGSATIVFSFQTKSTIATVGILASFQIDICFLAQFSSSCRGSDTYEIE